MVLSMHKKDTDLETKLYDSVIIGLGEIGRNTLLDMSRANRGVTFYGVDIDDRAIRELNKQGFDVGKDIPKSDVYLITVYTTQQVFNVLEKIDYSTKPLVSIESTLDLKRLDELIAYAEKRSFDLATFPHRYNPGDDQHRILNLHRVLGGITDESTERALEFYTKFMDRDLIFVTDFKTAALSKVLENAYRYMDIAIAESFKKDCAKMGINFDALRMAVNTKWNINLKEARDGIDGKCLPKDTQLLADFFTNDELIKTAIKLDAEYRRWLKR